MKQAVCGIFVDEGKVLLGLRSARKKAYANCWDLIGGHVENGETISEALERECTEEIGVVPTSYTDLGELIEPSPAVNGEARYRIFLVEDWVGTPVMRGSEHSEIRWFPISEACSLTNLALSAYIPFFLRIRVRHDH